MGGSREVTTVIDLSIPVNGTLVLVFRFDRDANVLYRVVRLSLVVQIGTKNTIKFMARWTASLASLFSSSKRQVCAHHTCSAIRPRNVPAALHFVHQHLDATGIVRLIAHRRELDNRLGRLRLRITKVRLRFPLLKGVRCPITYTFWYCSKTPPRIICRLQPFPSRCLLGQAFGMSLDVDVEPEPLYDNGQNHRRLRAIARITPRKRPSDRGSVGGAREPETRTLAD